jgi:hypothetical protein
MRRAAYRVPDPKRPFGVDDCTGASGACCTVFGLEELKVGVCCGTVVVLGGGLADGGGAGVAGVVILVWAKAPV